MRIEDAFYLSLMTWCFEGEMKRGTATLTLTLNGNEKRGNWGEKYKIKRREGKPGVGPMLVYMVSKQIHTPEYTIALHGRTGEVNTKTNRIEHNIKKESTT